MKGSRHTLNKENVDPSGLTLNSQSSFRLPLSKDLLSRRVARDGGSSLTQGPLSSAAPTAEKPKPEVDCNPQNVPEFSSSIRQYLQQKECFYQVSPSYMDSQTQLNPKMRAILVDWLVDVSLKFQLLPGTLFLTVNLVDRFLAREAVGRNRIQLVGIAALMVVAKFEEIYPPTLKDYVGVCDNAYAKEEILGMESLILVTLNFNLAQTSTFAFLQHIQLSARLDSKAFAFGRFVLENALFDLSLLKYSNLVVAAGATFLVLKIFKKDNWKHSFEETVGVSERVAKACAKDLFQMMQAQDSSPLVAVKRKFMSPEFFEVSKYRIEKISNSN